MKINQSKIAEQVGVDKGFVNFILEGRRNPNTAKGMQVVLAAAEQYAEVCKAEYVAKMLKKWKLHEKIVEKRKYAKSNKVKQTRDEKYPNRRTSKYKGVFWDASYSKWLSKIYYDKKYHFIGYFKTEQEAADAYEKEKVKLNK